ncbi:MAG: hypothetical protein ACLRWP_07680 [Bilophila wadsworthia]
MHNAIKDRTGHIVNESQPAPAVRGCACALLLRLLKKYDVDLIEQSHHRGRGRKRALRRADHDQQRAGAPL